MIIGNFNKLFNTEERHVFVQNVRVAFQIMFTFTPKSYKYRFFQFVHFFFFETTKPCVFPPKFVCDLITSFIAWFTPKSQWSVCLMSKTRCNVQNRISVKTLGFSFLNTTKKKCTPPLVGVYFDETLTNLINLTYSVYKPPFGSI